MNVCYYDVHNSSMSKSGRNGIGDIGMIMIVLVVAVVISSLGFLFLIASLKKGNRAGGTVVAVAVLLVGGDIMIMMFVLTLYIISISE